MPCALRKLATCQPAGIFLSTSQGDLTFAEVDSLVDRVATESLASSAVQILSEPLSETEQVVRVLAALRRGQPTALLNLRHPPETLVQQRSWLQDAAQHLPNFGGGGEWNLNNPATILFTSGSSSEPKSVVHTLRNHLSSALAVNERSEVSSGDRWLCPLPLYHVGGLAIVFRCLLAGATVCFPESRWTISDAVSFFKPTHLSMVPTQLRRWMTEPGFDPSGCTRVLLGGAPVPDDLRKAAEQRGVPLAVSYGMTETASQVTATVPGDLPVGAGKPLKHAQVGISEEGELLVKGSSVAMGMLDASGITPLVDEQGWLRTRDCGRMEDDVLYVEGRKDLQFISGGENIQPEVIERTLMDLSDISEAVVVPKPDVEFGARPVAWVDVEVTSDRVQEWNRALRKELPGYMIPVEYRRLQELKGVKRRRGELKP